MDPVALVLEVLDPFKFVLGGFLVLGAVVAVIAIIFGKSENSQAEAKEKRVFDYQARRSLMTPSEQLFYNALGAAVSQDFRIFAQVRLSALVDHQIKNGQNWKAALAHVNQKSVDFVLADKETFSTKLVIELDDRTHEREDRKERDGEVERILKAAGVPLLRIQNTSTFTTTDIESQVRTALGK